METGKVLVTGAAGFIGSHVVGRLLADGFQVVGIDNFNDFYNPAIKRANVAGFVEKSAFKLVECDIRDTKAVTMLMNEHRPDVLIHMAAMAGVRPSIANPELYADVNVTGTVVLLSAAESAGVKKIVFASSSSVYGNNSKVPFSESDPVDFPISPYAATKRAGELLAHSFYAVNEIPTVCLRFFTVYGPGQRPDLAIAKFMEYMRDGREITVFGDGDTSRDYTYIEDIVDGIVSAMYKATGYSIYNLGGDRPVTLSDLIAKISAVTGIEPRRKVVEMQPGDVTRTWADIGKAKRELGYSPKIDFSEGLERQWKSILSRG